MMYVKVCIQQKGSGMSRSLAAVLLPMLTLTGLVAGCSTSNENQPSRWDPEVAQDDKKPDNKNKNRSSGGGGGGGGASEEADDQPSGNTCTPKTCAQLGVTCGTHADGCGGTAACGACD